MREAFDLFDRDHSGGISLAELQSVMFALGQQVTSVDLQTLMSEVDTNGGARAPLRSRSRQARRPPD